MSNTPDNTGIIPSPRAFSLDSLKLVKNGGLDIMYRLEKNDGITTRFSDHHDKYTDGIHPDLRARLAQLRPIMARVYSHLFFRTLVETPEFKATANQKAMTEQAIQNVLAKIEVHGFSISGKDENLGIVLKGKFTSDSKMVMAINSHIMKFNGTTYGFEPELEDIVTAIEEEVYAYLYLGKKAELEAFDANGDAAPHVHDGKMAAAGEGRDDEPDMFPDENM